MRSQRRLRDELRFVTEFSTLLDVMQQVAVSQLRRYEERLTGEVNLSAMFEREFFPLLPSSARVDPLVRGGAKGRLMIVITSDEGMVGPLHANTVRAALAKADVATQWVVIGQRAMRWLGDQPRRVWSVALPSDAEVAPLMQRVSDVVLAQYAREDLQEVWLVAPRFLSAARQDVVTQRLLPLPVRQPEDRGGVSDLVIEPSVHRVVNQLASLWIEHRCTETLWSARCAEYAARALHVESSRDELSKWTKELRYAFFKSLHERVDVLVRETCVVHQQVARRLAQQRLRTDATASRVHVGV